MHVPTPQRTLEPSSEESYVVRNCWKTEALRELWQKDHCCAFRRVTDRRARKDHFGIYRTEGKHSVVTRSYRYSLFTFVAIFHHGHRIASTAAPNGRQGRLYCQVGLKLGAGWLGSARLAGNPYLLRNSLTFGCSFDVRLLMVGDSACGKTSLVLRFDQNVFSTKFVTTIGVDYRDKMVKVSNHKLVERGFGSCTPF